jgi:hypothetical protein
VNEPKEIKMDNLEERKSILKMIEEDKITAAEGLKLLEALSNESAQTRTSAVTISPRNTESFKGRMFRVVVTNTNTGKIKTHVTLPMSLVNWGLKIGSHYTPEIEGINIDELSQILQATSNGKIIDVLDEEDGEHVEIFID